MYLAKEQWKGKNLQAKHNRWDTVQKQIVGDAGSKPNYRVRTILYKRIKHTWAMVKKKTSTWLTEAPPLDGFH